MEELYEDVDSTLSEEDENSKSGSKSILNSILSGDVPLVHSRPVLWCAIGALIGGVLSLHLGSVWLLVLGLLALAGGFYLLYKRMRLCLLPLMLGLVLIRGVFLPRDTLLSGTYLVSGQVISLPEGRVSEGQVVDLWNLSVQGQSCSRILQVTLPPHTKVTYGDWVQLTAVIESGSDQSVASRQRGTATAITDTEVTVQEGQGLFLYGCILRLRQDIEKRIEVLFAPYAGEAKGMFLGQKEDISYSSYHAFVSSGLVHLLTVSGLHVGIVCGAVLKLIRGERPWLRGLVAGLFLLAYCALTGFSPSTLRAAIMVLTVFFMRTYTKQPDSLGALALSFALLVLLDPRYLTSLGFQLSFGAVWGLFMLSPPLNSLLIPSRRHNALWESLTASLGATIGTLPLLARATGQIQWIGLLLSPAVIPTAALFLIPGWVALGLHAIWAPLGELAAILPKGALIYIVKVSRLGTAAPLLFPTPGWVPILLWLVSLFFLSPCFLPNEERPPWIGYGLMGVSLIWWLIESFF